MPTTDQRRTIGAMTVRVQLLLEIDRGSNPISGTVGAAGGSARPFVGYAELVSELEALRQAPVRVLGEARWQGGLEP